MRAVELGAAHPFGLAAMTDRPSYVRSGTKRTWRLEQVMPVHWVKADIAIASVAI